MASDFHSCESTKGFVHMRIILIILLAIVSLPGCQRNVHWLPPPHPPADIPLAVRVLADRYVASAVKLQSENIQGIREDFSRNFFEGFKNPSAIVGDGTEAGRQGFLAGQEYRRANPTQFKEIMKGFGYLPIEADGVWTVPFEP